MKKKVEFKVFPLFTETPTSFEIEYFCSSNGIRSKFVCKMIINFNTYLLYKKNAANTLDIDIPI